MTPTAKDPTPQPGKDTVNPVLAAGLFLLALLPYATVNPTHRLLLAALSGAVGVALWARAPRGAEAPAFAKEVFALWGVAWLMTALAAIPLGPEGRAQLQPGFAEAIDGALAVVGASSHPLALDPWGALVGFSVVGGLLALSGGVAAAAARPGFTRAVCWGLVASGLLLLVIAAVHRGQGAPSIWWVSGVPAFARDPFFAPFVSPNHAGAACAALFGVSLGLVFSERGRARQAAVVSALCLLVGVAASGSRASALDALAALAAFAFVFGGRRARVVTGGLLLVGVVGALIVGPERVALWVTERVTPALYESIEAGYSDVLTGRGELYQDAIHALTQAPLLGVGGAGFGAAYELVRTSPNFATAAHAHQELLQVGVEHGLLVALLVLGVARSLLLGGGRAVAGTQDAARRARRAGALAGLAALFVDAQLDFPLRIGAIATLAAVLVGLVAAHTPAGGEGRRRGAWVLGVALVALVSASAAAWLDRAAPARSDWAPAEDALARGDEAIRLALEEKDESARAALVDAARAAYEEAIRRQPTRREALQRLGRLRRVQGDLEGARAALEAATRVTPSVPWPWRDLARLRAEQNDVDGASEAWSRALALDLPTDATPLVRAALAGATDLQARAERAIPPRADRWLMAARVAEERRDLASAEAFYRRAMALRPATAIELAGALLRWNRAEEASALLPEIEGSCRKSIVSSEIAFERGRHEEARDGFSEALKLCGARERRARLGLARARIALGEATGMRALEAMIEEDPSDGAAVRAMVRELEAKGQYLEASRYQELLARPKPSNVDEVAVPQR